MHNKFRTSTRQKECMTKRSNIDRIPLVPCNSRTDEPLEEDRRLKNWHRWLKDHQRHQERLVKSLGREALELALNAHEKSRIKNETRSLVEAASRSEVTNQDKYRGNPVFWKLPERLSKTNCESEKLVEEESQDDVFITMNRCERNLPPDMTRVALPNFILKEKMLLESYVDTQKPHLRSKWKHGDYLAQRTEKLKEEIKIIEPKKPEMENLILVGQNFQCNKKKKFIRLPVISITSDEPNKLLTDPDDRVNLFIQDREFVFEKGHFFEKLSLDKSKELQESKEDRNVKKYAYSVFESNRVYEILSKNAEPITWSLNFESKGDEICERKILFENRGIQTITLIWRNDTKKYIKEIPERIKSFFFFNKNQIFILPGQKYELFIWFRSERPRVVTETWKILVEPQMYPGTLSFRLWGVALGNSWKLRQEKRNEYVRDKLRTSVRNSIVQDIVEELFLAATDEPPEPDVPYSKLFLETDIFHSRNPAHFYNSVLIDELKSMYKCATDKEDWTLGLQDLRGILLKIEDVRLRRDTLVRFNNICMKSLRPSGIYEAPVLSKRKMTYYLLCTFFNNFEEESNFIASKCSWEDSDACPEGETYSEGGESKAESSIVNLEFPLFHETFYIKIYYTMCETIDRICAVLDSETYSSDKHIR